MPGGNNPPHSSSDTEENGVTSAPALGSTDFILGLKSAFPVDSQGLVGTDRILRDPWYLVAISSLVSLGESQAAAEVFKYVLEDLKSLQAGLGITDKAQLLQERQLLVKRFQEALLRASMHYGWPRGINGLHALYNGTPDELKDSTPMRDVNNTLQDYETMGHETFRSMYADKADSTLAMLGAIHPDLGRLLIIVGYGMTYAGSTGLDVISRMETSLLVGAVSVVMNNGTQAVWHLENAQNGGAAYEQVVGTKKIGTLVAKACGVMPYEGEIPCITKKGDST